MGRGNSSPYSGNVSWADGVDQAAPSEIGVFSDYGSPVAPIPQAPQGMPYQSVAPQGITGAFQNRPSLVGVFNPGGVPASGSYQAAPRPSMADLAASFRASRPEPVSFAPEPVEYTTPGSEQDAAYRLQYETSGYIPQGGWGSLYTDPSSLKTVRIGDTIHRAPRAWSPQSDAAKQERINIGPGWGPRSRGSRFKPLSPRLQSLINSGVKADQQVPTWRGYKMGGLLGNPLSVLTSPITGPIKGAMSGSLKDFGTGLLEPIVGPIHALPDWARFGAKGYEERGFKMGGLVGGGLETLGLKGFMRNMPLVKAYDKLIPDDYQIIPGMNEGGIAEESMGLGAIPGMMEAESGFGPGVDPGMQLPEGASVQDIGSMLSEEQVAAVVEEVKMALSGQHPQGEQLLAVVAEMFGQEFIQEIAQTFGMGDGMSDSIPASLGDEQIAVSEGEYIVPAREVASLGNGSTDAGGRALDRMVQEIRATTTGSPDSAPALDPRNFLAGGPIA